MHLYKKLNINLQLKIDNYIKNSNKKYIKCNIFRELRGFHK